MPAFYDYGREKYGFKLSRELEREGVKFVVDFTSYPVFTTRADAEAAEDEAEGFEFAVLTAHAQAARAEEARAARAQEAAAAPQSDDE